MTPIRSRPQHPGAASLRFVVLFCSLLALVLAAAGPAAAAEDEDAAAEPTLTGQARLAEREGRWTDAVDLWALAAAAPEENPGAWENYLRALDVAGLDDRLEDEAEAALEARPGWSEAAVHLARARAARGRVEEALRILDWPADAAWGDGLHTRAAAVERARLLTVLGRRDEAESLYREVMRSYDPNDDYRAAQLTAVADAARAMGAFQDAARVYELAYRAEPGYLPARLGLADLFQDKDQSQLADTELKAAFQIAPRHPDVLVTAARLGLRDNQMRRAEAAARSAVVLRPGDPSATAILAHLECVSERPEEAEKLLEPLLDRNPFDRNARSLLAAAAYLEGDSTGWHEESGRVLDQDPGYLDVYLTLASILEMGRRYDESLVLYRRVLAVEPENPEALTRMGLLYMREGDEETARGYLERGFDKDRFNIRAYNQLELLDKMDTFARYHTDHFEIRLEAEKDSVLVPLLKSRLEKIRADLVEAHGWAPDTPTVVEVFPSHDWFSARVTGLPWVGGIPAVCFGHVVAMDSPRTLSGRSNWEQILRHEYGHVLALGMTHKRVPFWFTEGLSVYLEQYPRSLHWDEVLKAAYVDHALVPVDSLTLAFTRPLDFDQRLLAYHESGLIIGDLVERKGWDVIPGLLRAFGEGKDLAEAVPDVVGESLEEFSRRGLDAVRRRAEAVAVWPSANPDRLSRLESVEKERGDELEYRELVALTRYQAGDAAGTTTLCERLLERDPGNARALGLLGLIDRREERPEKAIERLTAATEAGSRDVPVYVNLGEARAAAGDTTGALAAYAGALELYPGTVIARTNRAELLAASGRIAEARAEYRALLEHDDSAGSAAVALARLDLQDGDGTAAVDALEYAVDVLPVDADVQGLLGQAYLLLDRDDAAYDLFLRARALDLRSVESMVGMALFYLKREDFEEASYFAELALKYAPAHPTARRVLAEAQAW